MKCIFKPVLLTTDTHKQLVHVAYESKLPKCQNQQQLHKIEHATPWIAMQKGRSFKSWLWTKKQQSALMKFKGLYRSQCPC